MLRMAENFGDRLLSLAVPRIKARAYWCLHCTGAWSQRCWEDQYGNIWCTTRCMSC
jgi:hypothetical protein